MYSGTQAVADARAREARLEEAARWHVERTAMPQARSQHLSPRIEQLHDYGFWSGRLHSLVGTVTFVCGDCHMMQHVGHRLHQ